jgi:hypothetical protein
MHIAVLAANLAVMKDKSPPMVLVVHRMAACSAVTGPKVDAARSTVGVEALMLIAVLDVNLAAIMSKPPPQHRSSRALPPPLLLLRRLL